MVRLGHLAWVVHLDQGWAEGQEDRREALPVSRPFHRAYGTWHNCSGRTLFFRLRARPHRATWRELLQATLHPAVGHPEEEHRVVGSGR